MNALGRRSVVLGAILAALALGLAIGTVAPAVADTEQQCMDSGMNANGDLPTCTEENGNWVASYPDDGVGGSGIPGGFVALMVLAVIAGLGVTAWRVSTARRLAADAGLDPGMATKVALMTDNGLDATYLAASMRKTQQPAASPASSKGVAERLKELKGLLDSGLVTQVEYDERRKAIIDGV